MRSLKTSFPEDPQEFYNKKKNKISPNVIYCRKTKRKKPTQKWNFVLQIDLTYHKKKSLY